MTVVHKLMKFGKFVMKASMHDCVVSDEFFFVEQALKDKQATIMSRGTLFYRNLFQSLTNVLHLLFCITSWIWTQTETASRPLTIQPSCCIGGCWFNMGKDILEDISIQK